MYKNYMLAGVRYSQKHPLLIFTNGQSFCFTACEAGTYGLGCSKTCGNCIGTCNPENGVCALGCKDGWINSQCTESMEYYYN